MSADRLADDFVGENGLWPGDLARRVSADRLADDFVGSGTGRSTAGADAVSADRLADDFVGGGKVKWEALNPLRVSRSLGRRLRRPWAVS